MSGQGWKELEVGEGGVGQGVEEEGGRKGRRRGHTMTPGMDFDETFLLVIYVWYLDGKFVAITFHVDDSAILAKADYIGSVKSELKSKFNTHNLGELHQFVGIKITHNCASHTITISQGQYILDILNHAGMSNCNTTPTPMSPKQTLTKFKGCHNQLPWRLVGLTGQQTWAQPLGWPLSHWVH